MRVKKFLIVCVTILLTTGCVPSLHPLYTTQDLIFDPSLLGTWVDDDGETQWTIERAGEKEYTLTNIENGEAGKFKGRLLQLGKNRFLDLVPEEPDLKNETYKFHLIPAHSFVKLRMENDMIRVSVMSDAWLEKMIEDKKMDIAYEHLEDHDLMMLTAPTADLQRFVQKYADDKDAYPSDSSPLHRKKG